MPNFAFWNSGDGVGGWRYFFLPRLNRLFWMRLSIVAGAALVVFGVVLRPCVINGGSMLPTYPEHGFTFCFRPRYWFSNPSRGDVVVIKYHDNYYFLKRIVALPGETVEFRDGVLFVNGQAMEEPYLRYISDWQLPPRKVMPGHYYVVGDNRSQPLRRHRFGQVERSKIYGAPLF